MPWRSRSRAAPFPDALYWDTLDPYHYVRLQPGEGRTDYLIVGGADHKSGEADDAEVRFEALEAWARNLIPALEGRDPSLVRTGAGYHRLCRPSSAAIRASEHIYVHTGDSGQGMTHGVVGSLINSALILGETPQMAGVLRSYRAKLPSASAITSVRMLTAVKNFAEYLAPGELKSLDDLKPGHGAIVRQGLTKIAAYRDERRRASYARSAACTHLGCHLHWNSFEVCWDCPCHGSHFAVDGTALNALR